VDAAARLDAVCGVLDRLAPADRETIESLLPPWVRRARRLAQRDAAILALIAAHYLPQSNSGRAAAQACARDLRRYRASGWRLEQGKLPAGDGKRAGWHRILALNRGIAVGAERIRELMAGLRPAGGKSAPESIQNALHHASSQVGRPNEGFTGVQAHQRRRQQ
jgi:hypothetical protein